MFTTNLELSKLLKEKKVEVIAKFWWVLGRMRFGYEGEWEIETDKDISEWFLFTHRFGKKPDCDDFTTTLFSVDDDDWFEKRDKFLKKYAKKNIINSYTLCQLPAVLKQLQEKLFLSDIVCKTCGSVIYYSSSKSVAKNGIDTSFEKCCEIGGTNSCTRWKYHYLHCCELIADGKEEEAQNYLINILRDEE